MSEADYPQFKEKTTVIDTASFVRDATAVKDFLSKMARETSESDIMPVAALALTGFSKKYGFGSDGIFSLTLQRDKLPPEFAMHEELGNGELAVLDMVDIVSSNLVGYLREDSAGVPTSLSEQKVALIINVNLQSNPGSTVPMLVPVDAILHMEKFEGLE